MFYNFVDSHRFNTFFLKTYRNMDGDSTEKDVKFRHSAVYHIGRALFELVEFFGQTMGKKQRVYRGLSRPFLFEEFAGYFNSPISTTTEIIVGMFKFHDLKILHSLSNLKSLL